MTSPRLRGLPVLAILALAACLAACDGESAQQPVQGTPVAETPPEPATSPLPAPVAEPRFEGTAVPLPPAVVARMTGVSWRQGCPVPLEDLAYLELSYIDFAGAVRRGEMVVASAVAEDVIGVFRALFEARFPIERMQLVDDFAADDDRSMAANNTSAFNCRATTGGASFSQHSYGDAIDINPVQNPYVSGTLVLPPEGAAYADRSAARPGMILAGDTATAAFAAIGWVWGGDWTSLKDFQHFSRNGR